MEKRKRRTLKKKKVRKDCQIKARIGRKKKKKKRVGEWCILESRRRWKL